MGVIFAEVPLEIYTITNRVITQHDFYPKNPSPVETSFSLHHAPEISFFGWKGLYCLLPIHYFDDWQYVYQHRQSHSLLLQRRNKK